MTENNESLLEDINKIQKIPIIPTLLEVVCLSTGMGFAAVARVTESRWIACCVRDEINFGLQPGGELKVETTICNEIRDSHQLVAIDNVSEDELYCNHHTPKLYGIQSYISVPIILNTGEFFGTLCSIDPRPAKVSDLKTTGMFTMFAQLIAFHFHSLNTLEKSHQRIQQTTKQLAQAEQENRRYEHLTYHSLREPVRKISLYSDTLSRLAAASDLQKMQKTAADINRFSLELAGMLRQLDKSN